MADIMGGGRMPAAHRGGELTEEEIVREARGDTRGDAGSLDDCGHCPQGVYEFSRYCGAYVCYVCDDHKGLARCYCGWAADGGDGYGQLVEMGETIEEDGW